MSVKTRLTPTQIQDKTAGTADKSRDSCSPGGGMPKKRAIRLRSLKDCRRFCARVINDLHRGEIDENKSRAFGYLLSIMSSIVKDSEIESRLDELERIMASQETRR